jgi:hypothetical protein
MRKPWEINSRLNEEYLVEMAQFISDVRSEVVDLHDPDGVGDTKRSLGFRAYECIRKRITKEAASGSKPWLSVITEDNRFTFGIDSVPVRFYRGTPECPEERRLQASIEALNQISLLPPSESDPALRWLFVVETDELYYADKVTFCAFDACTSEQICVWEVPLEDTILSRPIVVAKRVDAVTPSPVKLSVIKPDSKDEAGSV